MKNYFFVFFIASVLSCITMEKPPLQKKQLMFEFKNYRVSDPTKTTIEESEQQYYSATARQQYEQRSKPTFSRAEDEYQLKKAYDLIFGAQPDYAQAKEILNFLSSRSSNNNHTKSQAIFLRGIMEFNGLGTEADLEKAQQSFKRIIYQYPEELSLQQPAKDFLLVTRAFVRIRHYVARSSSHLEALSGAQTIIAKLPERLINQALIEKITRILQSKFPDFNPDDRSLSLKQTIWSDYSAGPLLYKSSGESEAFKKSRKDND